MDYPAKRYLVSAPEDAEMWLEGGVSIKLGEKTSMFKMHCKRIGLVREKKPQVLPNRHCLRSSCALRLRPVDLGIQVCAV